MLTATEVRKQNIIAALSQPMTVDDLREVIQVPIHTLYRDLRELRESGIIVPTGTVKDRKPHYVVANKRPIPQLYRRKFNDHVSPLAIQAHAAANPTEITDSMAAARYIAIAVSELLMASVHAAQSATPTGLEGELSRIRENLKESISRLTNTADMMQQLLTNPAWWSANTLKQLANDPEWNAEQIFANHSTILRSLHEQQEEAQATS